MNTTENDKLRLTQKDSDFIEALIKRNQGVMCAAVRSVLQENYNVLGEDCIAEIYLLCCQKIRVLKNHENPDGWLAVASKRVSLAVNRKYKERLSRTADYEPINADSQIDVFEEALYDSWLEGGAIEKLLSVLTPREREIYELVYLKRMKAVDVATLLGVSGSTVRNTTASIRRKLENAIKEKFY